MIPERLQESSDHPQRTAVSIALQWLIGKLAKTELTAIRIILPENEGCTLGSYSSSQAVPTVEVMRPKNLIKATRSGLLGWAEAYINGDWTTRDLRQLMHWATVNEQALETAFSMSWPARVFNRLIHLSNHNSRKGSRRNIAAHYDLGNHFYQHWLDESMTYSSGVFRDEEETLEQAQIHKIEHLINWLELEPESSVLEIGCGWGGFARALNEKGDHPYLGVTLSQEQLSYAKSQSAHQQQFELQDYRDIDGQYDRIVSIEMLEAVGESHWSTYFQKIYDCLKPGGIAVIQVITIAEERFERYRKNADFIQRYIFPGGMLPSHDIMLDSIKSVGLLPDQQLSFGKDYARTLNHWYQRFNKAWHEIRKSDFDDAFLNMWNYYLCYCEAGFNSQSTDVRIYQCRKPL